MTGISKLSNPPCIEAHRPGVKAYIEQAYSIVSLICSHLDTQLRLTPGTLASLQPMSLSSGTALRMLRYPSQPVGDQRTSLRGHTDLGTLTILFNITGGLQLLLPGTDPRDESSWVYVQPVPGCAIVGLGDTMVQWSAGILRSNMHRVTFAPGEQGEVTRYSLAYLVRPYSEAPMKRLSGGNSLIPELEEGEEDTTINAREWEARRVAALRKGQDNTRSKGGREIKLEDKNKVSAVIVGRAE
jgi:isopenicillin N synthase-like dioxygenase